MTTIDKLDIQVYIQYARRTQYIEGVKKEFQLDKAPSIPPQTYITGQHPQMSEIDALLGVVRSYAPWAYFLPPRKFNKRRRSPFTFSRVSPSVETDEDADEMENFDNIQTSSSEEAKEKEAIKGCLKQLNSINEWLGQIIGRIGQLLQG